MLYDNILFTEKQFSDVYFYINIDILVFIRL